MPIKLHNLKPARGAKHRPKRIGRGNASGHGTFSGRGVKGQKARSGSGRGRMQRKGLRRLIFSTPKLRGFKSIYAKPAVFNLDVLENKFQDGEKVSLDSLKEKGLIGKMEKEAKILGDGKLSKKLEIEGCLVSESARGKIKKAGGTIRV